MDRTRKANRQDDEVTLQYRTHNDVLREGELIEEKLKQLQATVAQLEQTPQGMAELQRRTALYGELAETTGLASAETCATATERLQSLPTYAALLADPELDQLTSREKEVMRHIVDGTYDQVGTFNGNPLSVAAARAMRIQ